MYLNEMYLILRYMPSPSTFHSTATRQALPARHASASSARSTFTCSIEKEASYTSPSGRAADGTVSLASDSP